MDQLKKVFSLIAAHKGKFVLSFFSMIVFIFVLFPFDDLGDLVSGQISKLTQNQVYLQFDHLEMNTFPTPGVALDAVYLETRGFPPIKVTSLILTPSISALISQKPAGSLVAEGILGGRVEASIGGAPKSDTGTERNKIILRAESLNLSDLREFASLPMTLKGRLNLDTEAIADLSFTEQPDVDVVLKIDRFELPPANVQTMMGPITLPDLKLGSVEIKGRLSAGNLIIEEGKIGRDGDEVLGTVKGKMGLTIQNRGGNIAPILGGYQLDIDLRIRKSFEDRASLFLGFISQYKTALPDGGRYAFKLNAANPMLPPSMSALR